MNRLIIVLAALLVLLFSSCSKEKTYTVKDVAGVKVYSNNGMPAEPDLKINLTKLFAIEGVPKDETDSTKIFTDVCEIAFDAKDNLYVLCVKSCRISKYSADGTFVKSFGGKGNGPGEMIYPQGLLILNDTIKVLDAPRKIMVKYNTNGDFVGSQSTKDCNMPVYLKKLGDEFVSTYLCNWRLDDKKEAVMDYDFAIIDTDFNIKKILFKQSFKQKDLEDVDTVHPNSSGKDVLFFSPTSRDKYVVDVYDFTGKKLYQINKNCRKISFKEYELKQQSASWLMDAPAKEAYIKDILAKRPFKPIISSMLTDSLNRLWVFPSIERDEKNYNQAVVDLFKDGVFLNRVTLPLAVYSEDTFSKRFVIHKDKLLVVDQENLIITAYKYN